MLRTKYLRGNVLMDVESPGAGGEESSRRYEEYHGLQFEIIGNNTADLKINRPITLKDLNDAITGFLASNKEKKWSLIVRIGDRGSVEDLGIPAARNIREHTAYLNEENLFSLVYISPQGGMISMLATMLQRIAGNITPSIEKVFSVSLTHPQAKERIIGHYYQLIGDTRNDKLPRNLIDDLDSFFSSQSK